MAPKNERVSNADLYKAITDLERHLDGRIDGFERAVSDRCTGIDERIAAHEKSDHSGGGSIRTPTTVASAVAAIVAALLAGLAEVFRR